MRQRTGSALFALLITIGTAALSGAALAFRDENRSLAVVAILCVTGALAMPAEIALGALGIGIGLCCYALTGSLLLSLVAALVGGGLLALSYVSQARRHRRLEAEETPRAATGNSATTR